MSVQYEHILKSHKLSLTAVRLSVLEALTLYPHSEAADIYNHVKNDISTASKQAIYNNLNTLVAHGVVREIKPKGRAALYETRVKDNHHHIVCRHCDVIIDTDCLDSAPCLVSLDDHGFAIDEAEIILWGTCPACQKNKPHQIKGE